MVFHCVIGFFWMKNTVYLLDPNQKCWIYSDSHRSNAHRHQWWVRFTLLQFSSKIKFAAIYFRAIHNCFIKQSQMLSLRLVFDNWIICFSSNMILFHCPCLKAFQKITLHQCRKQLGWIWRKKISTKFFWLSWLARGSHSYYLSFVFFFPKNFLKRIWGFQIFLKISRWD